MEAVDITRRTLTLVIRHVLHEVSQHFTFNHAHYDKVITYNENYY
jgi:hypothetical protein